MHIKTDDMKNCIYCGKPLIKNARYCAYCGEPTDNFSGVTDKKELDIGHRVILCTDGKYRWIYRLHMLKNLTIFFDVLVVLGMSAFIVMIINLVIMLFDGNIGIDTFKGFGQLLLIVGGILVVISFIGYFIFAAMNGWYYIALFEMDNEGVTHHQLGKSVKSAKAIGWISVLAGLATKDPGSIGRGITTATRSSMSSSFESVRKVKAQRKNNVIKVNELLSRNRIYVQSEDFDFVYEFIRSRCPRLKKVNDKENSKSLQKF